MKEKYLDLNYINQLKNDKNIVELQELKNNLKEYINKNNITLEIKLELYDLFLEKIIVYKNNNLINYYCRELITEYNSILKENNENEFLNYFTNINSDTMSEDKNFANKSSNNVKNKFYQILFIIIFDNLDKLDINNMISKDIKDGILTNFEKIKNNKVEDWITTNSKSIKVIEPLIRNLFEINNWEYTYLDNKGKLKNKTLDKLLNTKEFRNLNPNYCDGLNMLLCNSNGLNIRNHENHNYDENSSNPNISKICFIIILSILDLYDNIKINKYYRIIKSKIETHDWDFIKINNVSLNIKSSHLEAINYLQWEFMSDRKDKRINKIFDYVLKPKGVNEGSVDINFSKYSVDEFLKEIIKIKD